MVLNTPTIAETAGVTVSQSGVDKGTLKTTLSGGGVFFQTDNVTSILGVLFQGMLFVMLGGMITAPLFVDERLIYYKQKNSNYFGAFSFVFAKAISKLPQVRTQIF